MGRFTLLPEIVAIVSICLVISSIASANNRTLNKAVSVGNNSLDIGSKDVSSRDVAGADYAALDYPSNEKPDSYRGNDYEVDYPPHVMHHAHQISVALSHHILHLVLPPEPTPGADNGAKFPVHPNKPLESENLRARNEEIVPDQSEISSRKFPDAVHNRLGRLRLKDKNHVDAKNTSKKDEILRKLRQNILTELRILAHLAIDSFTNVTHAAHELITDLASETLSLASVIAYLPELILLDGPAQLLETLKIIRNHSSKDKHSALDTVIFFLEGDTKPARKIRKNIKPAFSFLPKVFYSVGTFFHRIFDTLMGLFE
jgi:hypothetical protein